MEKKEVKNGLKLPENVDEYIAGFPEEVRTALQEMRETVRQAAPDAVETISYSMPAYKLNGILVYFAAFRNHLSLFPTAEGISAFKDELSGYRCSKGTVQFPFESEIPWDLIERIVRHRVEQNAGKGKKQSKK